MQTVCPAGTVVAWHQNVWHAARSNYTDHDRYMFKLRLNPTVQQIKLWDCSDLDSFDPDGILNHSFPWTGDEERNDFLHRTRMWRFLTDNPNFDVRGYIRHTSADHTALPRLEPAIS